MLIDNLIILYLVYILFRNKFYFLIFEVLFFLLLLVCVEWNEKIKIVKRINNLVLIFVILIIECFVKVDYWKYIFVEIFYFFCYCF